MMKVYDILLCKIETYFFLTFSPTLIDVLGAAEVVDTGEFSTRADAFEVKATPLGMPIMNQDVAFVWAHF